MHICIFEDEASPHFFPLSLLRPVYDLRCGILSLRQRILTVLPHDSLTLGAREYLAPLLREENPGIDVNVLPESETDCLFVNGRTVQSADLARHLRRENGEFVLRSDGTILAARLKGKNLVSTGQDFLGGKGGDAPSSVPEIEAESKLASYPWDLIYANETELLTDFLLLTKKGSRVRKGGKIHRTAVLISGKLVHIGKKTEVGPHAVIDASEGPVYIGQRVTIQAHSFIQGPCSIGDGSLIKAGSRIGPYTTIGPVCKVAGEVEHSIFLSYANKQHDGYLGHSYLSSWVNLGAGTTTSNLKNTYGNIQVEVNGTFVDTERMFIGLTAGDHVKTGINATLNTGTVIGVSSNVFGTDLPPKSIPSFAWGDAAGFSLYDLEKAIAVMKKVMARRSIVATDVYKDAVRHVFEQTKNDRSGIIQD